METSAFSGPRPSGGKLVVLFLGQGFGVNKFEGFGIPRWYGGAGGSSTRGKHFSSFFYLNFISLLVLELGTI